MPRAVQHRKYYWMDDPIYATGRLLYQATEESLRQYYDGLELDPYIELIMKGIGWSFDVPMERMGWAKDEDMLMYLIFELAPDA